LSSRQPARRSKVILARDLPTPARPDQSAAAALFAMKQIDVSITYCSASAALEKELPELTSLVIPAELDPHPLYGMAVLSSKPEAMRLALYLLSRKGEAILLKNGFVPVTDAGPRSGGGAASE